MVSWAQIQTALATFLKVYRLLYLGNNNFLSGSGNAMWGNMNSFMGDNNINIGFNNKVGGSNNWVTGANHNFGANGLKMFGPDAHPSFTGGPPMMNGFFSGGW